MNQVNNVLCYINLSFNDQSIKAANMSCLAAEISLDVYSNGNTNKKMKKCTEICKILSTRIDVYETLCPQQMLVHKGGKIKNWGGECRDVTPTKLQSQNIFKESTGGGGGGGWVGGFRMDETKN